MARVLNNTGIAAKLKCLIGVEDNGVIKCFKSIDSTNTDNTSLVQGDMTIVGTITYGTDTWGGGSSGVSKTVDTAKTTVSTSYVQFGTNKPWMRTSTAPTNGIGSIYIGRTTRGSNQSLVRPTAGRILTGGSVFSNPNWVPEMIAEGIVIAQSANAATQDGANAYSLPLTIYMNHNANTSAGNKFYFAMHNAAMVLDNSVANNGSTGIGNCSLDRYFNDTAGTSFFHPGITIFGIIDDDYASDAARLTDLQALHNDPYGTLFASSTVLPVMMFDNP